MPKDAQAAWLSQPARILLTIAAAGGAAWAVYAGRELIAPIIVSAVLIITLHPVRRGADRRGLPRWLGTAAVIAVAYAVLIGLAACVLLALGQFRHVLEDYSDELAYASDAFIEFFASLGFDAPTFAEISASVQPASLLHYLFEAGTALLSLGSAALFVLVYIFVMAADGSRAGDMPSTLLQSHAARLHAFRRFARSTRRYFAVNTVFGIIVAVIDGLVLWALGIPAPFVWAVLAFVTNYIPNIGFVIGMVPPVVLAVVTGGWPLGAVVFILYCAVNVLLQVIVQPHFVSRTVSLNLTLTLISVVVWTMLLGPIGSLLAIPLTLLTRFLLVGADPGSRLTRWLTGESEGEGDADPSGSASADSPGPSRRHPADE